MIGTRFRPKSKGGNAREGSCTATPTEGPKKSQQDKVESEETPTRLQSFGIRRAQRAMAEVHFRLSRDIRRLPLASGSAFKGSGLALNFVLTRLPGYAT